MSAQEAHPNLERRQDQVVELRPRRLDQSCAGPTVFYREQASGFGRDASLCDEGHFEALVRMFCQALKTIDTLPQTQPPAVLARLNAVRQVSHNFGHGVDESIDSLLEGHGGCG